MLLHAACLMLIRHAVIILLFFFRYFLHAARHLPLRFAIVSPVFAAAIAIDYFHAYAADVA